jgi:hypothetical protein
VNVTLVIIEGGIQYEWHLHSATAKMMKNIMNVINYYKVFVPSGYEK